LARLACALLALALLPAVAGAADWEPLGVGSRWEYRGVGGLHQVVSITGNTVLHGRVVAVKSFAEAPDAGLQNYWLLDPDGSVLLAGFLDSANEFGVVYEPPIRYFSAPPVVGRKPSQVITGHDIFTDDVLFSSPLEFDITEEVTLVEPAGTFHAFGVGQLIPLPGPALQPGVARSLDGRKLSTGGARIYDVYTTDWYTEGVGVVQYDTADLYQLVGYGLATPTATSSWASLKRLYR